MLTHTHAHNQTTFLSPAHEAPFKRGLQEDGVYAKQVRCANLTSALTHACVHADITCTQCTSPTPPDRVPDESVTVITAIFTGDSFICRHRMQILKLARE